MARKRTIKFDVSDEMHAFVGHAAVEAGVPVAEYVREAAIVRASFDACRNGGDFPDALAGAYEAVHLATTTYPARRHRRHSRPGG